MELGLIPTQYWMGTKGYDLANRLEAPESTRVVSKICVDCDINQIMHHSMWWKTLSTILMFLFYSVFNHAYHFFNRPITPMGDPASPRFPRILGYHMYPPHGL